MVKHLTCIGIVADCYGIVQEFENNIFSVYPYSYQMWSHDLQWEGLFRPLPVGIGLSINDTFIYFIYSTSNEGIKPEKKSNFMLQFEKKCHFKNSL